MHEITRKVGETIIIGENIQLTILAAQGSKTRIAVYNPKREVVATAGGEESNCNRSRGAAYAPLISGCFFGEGEADQQE